jgi:hypothetical protein
MYLSCVRSHERDCAPGGQVHHPRRQDHGRDPGRRLPVQVKTKFKREEGRRWRGERGGGGGRKGEGGGGGRKGEGEGGESAFTGWAYIGSISYYIITSCITEARHELRQSLEEGWNTLLLKKVLVWPKLRIWEARYVL